MAFAAGGIYFFAAFDPEHQAGIFPKCGFYVLTGYRCPGCGTQRALHHLLHGDIVGAFKLNALAFVAVPYIVLVSLAHKSRRFIEKFPRTAAALSGYKSTLMAVVAVMAFWIARNIWGF